MADIAQNSRIDRILIDLPGGSASQARDIAELVAAGLAGTGALPQAGDVPTLRVTITADMRTDPATLAHRIVAATLRELARVP